MAQQQNPTTNAPVTGGYRPTPEVESPDSQKSSEKNAGEKYDTNVSRKYGSDQDEDVKERAGQPAEWQPPGQDSFPGVENTPEKPTQGQNENPSRRWL